MSVDTAYDPLEGVEEAKKVVQWAEEAEAKAFQAVDDVRGELALGRATKGDLNRAQRKHADLMETRLTAEARIRQLRRDYAAEQAAEEARREAERRAVVAKLIPERESIDREFVELLGAFVAGLDALLPAVAEWGERAAAAEPPNRPYVPNRGANPRPGSIALTQPGSAFARASEAARQALAQANPRR